MIVQSAISHSAFFCAKNQLDLKTTLVVIVVADEQVKKITNTFKPLKKVKGEKGHE